MSTKYNACMKIEGTNVCIDVWPGTQCAEGGRERREDVVVDPSVQGTEGQGVQGAGLYCLLR